MNFPWLVVYTKPRAEKKLTERLEALGYEVYCPTQRIKKRWSDRWKWVEQPLFTSHIFVRIEPEKRDALYYVPGFVRFLFWLKKPAVVRDEEIATLKRWLNEHDHEAIQVHALELGQTVRVGSGPLQGQQGTVTELRGQHMELTLDGLQMKVVLDLNYTAIDGN